MRLIPSRYLCSVIALAFLQGAAAQTLAPSEVAILSALDPSRALQDVARISHSADGIPQGVGEGSVVSGSAEETSLSQTLASRMRELGLQVRVEPFPVRSYRYGVPVFTADGTAIPALSLHAAGAVWGQRDGVAFTRGNEAGGRRLRTVLVDAGEGYAADYTRIGDVGGKAVLLRREMRDWPPAQITEAALRGAVAVVFHDHPSAGTHIDALRQDSMWAHEQLPTVAISIREAQALQGLMRQKPVMITLESEVVIRDGSSRNVLGVLQGDEFPDEWVVVSGHYDRWFRGALDNVSGTAAVLEVARAFRQAGVRPRRSVLFMAAGSEEAGQEDPERDWLAGSYAFVQAHPEILRRAALVINLDGVGWTPSAARLAASPDVLAGQRRLLADLGLAATAAANPFTGSTIDAWNFGVAGGAATVALLTWDDSYTPLYHTQEDIFRPERFVNMARDLRIVALGAFRAATAPRAEVSLLAVADAVEAGLGKEVPTLPGTSFADLRFALQEFRTTAAAVEALGSTDAVRVLMSARHALVPWLYASNGDFAQALRPDEYTRRVQALDAAITALRAGRASAAREALSQLYEGRQCQRFSAATYARERGYWAGEGGWASRFGHRAPPPLPAFDAACRALIADPSHPEAAIGGLQAARDEALLAVEQSLALMAAKLREASAALRESGLALPAPAIPEQI